jgi:hypothetical protein
VTFLHRSLTTKNNEAADHAKQSRNFEDVCFCSSDLSVSAGKSGGFSGLGCLIIKAPGRLLIDPN